MPTRPDASPDIAAAGHASAPPASVSALVEALPFPVAIFDTGLLLVGANNRFRDLTGLSEQQARGRAIRNAFPNTLGDLTMQIEAATRGNAPASTRIAFRRGTGERVIDATFTPLGVDGNDGIVFAGVEVTDRDDAREERLLAVRQLASGVLHDINNVLNPIMAAAYLLDMNATNPDAVRDYTARIKTAVELGAATAARVGRFIRQEPLQGSGVEELVDLSAVVGEVATMARPSWAERSTGPIEFQDDLAAGVFVRGIAGELRAAVLNLVQNALDAMSPKGGALEIRTSVLGDTAVLDVRDTGIGMSPDVRERAFDPFFSTKGRGSAGLGLAEVYGITKRHNGRAEIDTIPGIGTTVRLIFPLAGRGTGPGADRIRATAGGSTLTT